MALMETVDGVPVRAAIFDLDGVLTDTAEAHFQAWKATFDEVLSVQLGRNAPPFTQEDYFNHVDGIPRLEGVRAFLASRGVGLPEGTADNPDLATQNGVAAVKDRRFGAWLDANDVPAFEDAKAFLDALTASGIATGVFSASRNARRVLTAAGLAGKPDTILDGAAAGELGLAAKPDPAELIETARRLGAEPAETIVVEDAVSGVEAGARGRFGMVIGLARKGGPEHRHALRVAGADLVTSDLGRLILDGRPRSLAALASAWDYAKIARGPLAVFLDYDGTLSPIVEDPQAAILSVGTREAIGRLARRYPVAVVSGRDLADVRDRVGLGEPFYAGSHGFDIAGPGGVAKRPSEAERLRDQIDAVEAALREVTSGIRGAEVERKTFSVAAHYRRIAEGDVPAFEAAVEDVASRHPELGKTRGKKVVEFQPRVAWDKGRAVGWMLAHTPLGEGDPLPVYIGDDLTDEDAFEALSGRGLCIALRGGARLTLADCALEDVDEVGRFLCHLAEVPR